MRLVFLVQNISGVLIVGQDELCASLSSCPSIIKRACRRRAAQVFAAFAAKTKPAQPRPLRGRGWAGTFKNETAESRFILESCAAHAYNGALREQSNLLFIRYGSFFRSSMKNRENAIVAGFLGMLLGGII